MTEQQLVWNLDQLRSLVGSLQDKLILDNVSTYLDSIYFKFYIAGYHKQEIDKIIGRLFEEHPDEDSSGIGFILEQASGSTCGKKFLYACKCAEANIVAYTQCLHASVEILGNVIVYSLQMQKLLERGKWYAFDVKNELKKINKAEKLAQCMESLLSSSIYQYIAAYSNFHKHENHLAMPFTATFSNDTCRSGIKLAAFTSKDFRGNKVVYNEKWCDDLIAESEFIFVAIPTVGNELTTYISSV